MALRKFSVSLGAQGDARAAPLDAMPQKLGVQASPLHLMSVKPGFFQLSINLIQALVGFGFGASKNTYVVNISDVDNSLLDIRWDASINQSPALLETG